MEVLASVGIIASILCLVFLWFGLDQWNTARKAIKENDTLREFGYRMTKHTENATGLLEVASDTADLNANTIDLLNQAVEEWKGKATLYLDRLNQAVERQSNQPVLVLKEVYRKACMKYHPDRGGDQKSMLVVQWVFSELKEANRQ